MKPKLISNQEIFMNRYWFRGLFLKYLLPKKILLLQYLLREVINYCTFLRCWMPSEPTFFSEVWKNTVAVQSLMIKWRPWEVIKWKTTVPSLQSLTLLSFLLLFPSGVMWDDHLICYRGLVSECQTLLSSFERWSEQMVREVLQKFMQKCSSG